MLTQITINTVPGNRSVFNAFMYNRRVLKVKREGMGYDIVRGVDAVGRQVRVYNSGLMRFETPFVPGEKVYVLYKSI